MVKQLLGDKYDVELVQKFKNTKNGASQCTEKRNFNIKNQMNSLRLVIQKKSKLMNTIKM